MGGRSQSGSSMTMATTAPNTITAMPFTMACWCAPDNVSGTNTLMVVAGAGDTDFVGFGRSAAAGAVSAQQASGSVLSATVASAMAVNQWHYVVLRGIASGNIRASILRENGLVFHVQLTTAVAPAAFTRVRIGGAFTSFWSGSWAELFVTDYDIQPGGAQLDVSLLRQLAYHGPFSVPHIAARVRDYRPFRSGIATGGVEAPEDIFSGADGVRSWTNNNGVASSYHPPLIEPYRRVTPGRVIVPLP